MFRGESQHLPLHGSQPYMALFLGAGVLVFINCPLLWSQRKKLLPPAKPLPLTLYSPLPMSSGEYDHPESDSHWASNAHLLISYIT